MRTPREVFEVVKKMHDRDLHRTMLAICKKYNVTLEAVVSGKRSVRIVEARDACVTYLYDVSRFSTTEIGDLFSMHHTSIIDAMRRHARRAATSPP